MAREQARVDLFINSKGAEASLRELKRDATTLKRELASMSENDPRFAATAKRLQEVSGRMDELNAKIRGTSKMWDFMKSNMMSFGAAAMGIFGGTALLNGIRSVTQQSARLSDQIADIQKTTGLTRREIDELNKAFQRMDTRTSTEDLREMAIVAGQLGYNSQQDVLKFVGAMDKLNVALGDEFGSAEQITKELGGLRNVFTDIKSTNVDQDLLHIGNAINELSAAGAATAPVVSDFANRIGGMGINLGLSTGEVLGMSAALQELNVPAERGGTAVVRILQKMTTETKQFADIAGMSIKEYEQLLNTDLYGAFVRVIQKSQEGGKSTTQFASMMQDAELKAAGASEVFSKLGRNTELLDSKVKLASSSLKDTNSVMNEFAVKNDNLAAKLEKLQKFFLGIFVNPALMSGIDKLVGFIADLVVPTESAAEAARKEEYELRRTTSTIMTLNVGNAKRKELIEQLKSAYPQHLANIDAETVSNDELQISLHRVNDELIRKIALSIKQDAVMEQAKATAEAQVKLTEAEIDLQKKLLSVQEENSRSRNLRDRLQRQGTSIPDQAQVTLLSTPELGLSGLNPNVQRLDKAYESYADALTDYNLEKQKSVQLDKELLEFQRLLGLDAPAAATGKGKAARPTGSAVDTEADSKDKAAKIKSDMDYHKLVEDMERKHRDALASLREDDRMRELEQLHNKYIDLEVARKQSYHKEMEDLRKSHEEGTLSTTEYHKRVQALDKLFARQKSDNADLQRRDVNEIHKKWDEQDIARMKAHFDKLNALQQERDAINMDIARGRLTGMGLQMQIDGNTQGAENIEMQKLNFEHEMRLGQIQQETEAKKQAILEEMAAESSSRTLKEEEINAYLLRIQETEYNAKLAVDQADQESHNKQQERITERERRESASRRKIAGEVIKMTQDTVNTGFIIESNNRQSRENAELGSLQRKRDAELSNKNLTEEQKAQINAKYDAQERELRKRYWKSQQRAAMLQAGINGALAITNIWATTPKADFGVSTAVLLGASALATGLQIATIASTPQPEFSRGGFTGKGFGVPDRSGFKRAGIVHEDEWVAPKWMVNSPEYGPSIEALEAVRSEGMAKGGFFKKAVKSVQNVANAVINPGGNSEADSSPLLIAINGLREDIANWQTEFKVYQNLGEVEEGLRSRKVIQRQNPL